MSSKARNKLRRIERLYGKDRGTTTMADCAEQLKKLGYKSLANIIYPINE